MVVVFEEDVGCVVVETIALLVVVGEVTVAVIEGSTDATDVLDGA